MSFAGQAWLKKNHNCCRSSVCSVCTFFIVSVQQWSSSVPRSTRIFLCYSGCIDGYSRRLQWLEVNPSNNDRQCIARYYMECVRHLKGCATYITCDAGTENTTVAALHCYFHDSTECHRYVKSTANQRIEAFWCQLRRNRLEFYLDF